MYTQCPKCLTYFQVTAEHLKVAQGNVRCGQCSNVFSALGNLSEVPPQGTNTKSSNNSTPHKPITNTQSGSTSATSASAQSKLTNAIAAIQALNQSSQKILTQGKKNYISQLQRQAQAKRKYTSIDGSSSTARDLNQDDPENEQLEITQTTVDHHEDINFDEALAAVDDIDIDIDDVDELNEEESPIKFGVSGDEDITPAIDGSHLVEDYNVNESYLEKNNPDSKISARQLQAKPAKTNDDEFDYSGLELPQTDEPAVAEFKEKQTKTADSKRKKKPGKKKAIKKKPVSKKPQKKVDAESTPQHIVSDPEVVIENNIPTLAIPKQLLEDFEQDHHVSPAHYRTMITWGILSLMLMFTFLGQAIYFKHNELGQVSQLRPYVEFFCKHASCELSMQTDIAQIELLGQDIRSHPKNKKALLVSATIINNASFTQSYPGLRLSFSDINGEKVASRNFLPNNYLPKNLDVNKGMESNVPIHLELEIVDPGTSAVNFEFDFFSI